MSDAFKQSEGISRREVLKNLTGAIAVAALAPWRGSALVGAMAVPSGIRTPQPAIPAVGTENASFFAPREKEMVATVADLIIPTDEVSPGARAAGVHDWIDFVVANSPAGVQQRWQEGLAALDRASEESDGKKFLELEPELQRRLLERFAGREDSPATPGERFFVLAKEATVNGYYTSEIGLLKDLKYQGATYVSEPDTSCPAKHAGSEKP